MKRASFTTSPAHASQRRLFGQTNAYLMGVFGLNPIDWFRSKWGISDKTTARRAQVDKDRPGVVYVLFSRQILWGWACEQLVHFFYQLQHAPYRKGTGRTEFYWNFNPIFGSCFLYFTVRDGLVFEWYWYACGYLLPFVWIDGLLWLIFFRILGWALCCGLAYLIFLIVKTFDFGQF